MKDGRIIVFLIMLFAVQLFGQSDAVQIHGFVSQGFMMSNENNYQGQTKDGTFEFNELGINFSTEITTDLRVGLQFFARDLGEVGNDEITVDWAYGDYKWKNWLGLRAGKMKMPAGLYNEYRDLDFSRVSIFLPQGVYNETWRDTHSHLKGIGLYGMFDGGSAGSIDYQIQAGVMNYNTRTGMNKYIEDLLYSTIEKYDQTTKYLANLVWDTPIPNLKIGGTAQTSTLAAHGITDESTRWEEQTVNIIRGFGAGMGLPADQLPATYTDKASYEYAKQWLYQVTQAGGQPFTIDMVNTPVVDDIYDVKYYFASAEYAPGNLVLAAEYYMTVAKTKLTFTDYSALIPSSKRKNKYGGYYGSIAYRFNDFLQAGTYYSEFYNDFDDKEGKIIERDYGIPGAYNYLKDLTVSLRLDLNSNWILKVEGHQFNGAANLLQRDQEDPLNIKKNWMLFAGKLTYNF